MHKLLEKQLRKIGYDGSCLSDEKFKQFLTLVEQTYKDDDEDREFLEHTLEVSSKEMHELYEELEKKSQTRLAQSEERFRMLAKQDSLTGIANRFALEEKLKTLISYSKRFDKKFALLFLDLDRFKHINDSLGHDFGDKLLKEVVARISTELRSEDIFARIGGDEFVIVFTNITESGLYKAVDKILALFRKPWEIDEHILTVSTSIGVVLYPKDGQNGVELLKHADIAMYRAKSIGRDNFSFFTKDLNEKVLRDIKLELDMQKAIKKGEFELLYQPKVEIDSNKIIGAEALVRWNHPELGILLPEEFIPIAEHNGFIIKLGEWMLKESCRDIKYFNSIVKFDDFHISVDISIKQLEMDTTYDVIKDAIKDINASSLIIEINESMLIKDIEFINEMLHKVKRLGIRISMDDFGIGYSSLSQLCKLPIDSIKIDKFFVSDIPRESNNLKDKIIIDTIIAMADTLNLCLIAEGVEMQYQLEYLKSKGCKYYQGELYSPLLTKDEYVKLIRS